MENRKKIDKGLWLESENILIPWGATENELQNIKNLQKPSEITYSWTNQIVFGIEGVNVTITFDKYENENSVRFFRFMKNSGSVLDSYEMINSHLIKEFGKPTSNEKDEYNYPHTVWELGSAEIILGIAERFMDYLVFVLRVKSA